MHRRCQFSLFSLCRWTRAYAQCAKSDHQSHTGVSRYFTSPTRIQSHICFPNKKTKMSALSIFCVAFPAGLNPFGGMPNVPMSQAPMATRAASPINHQQINMNQVPTMNMSPTRMPPTQSMLGAHGGNMVAQTPNQTQFMAQPQFPANTNAMNVNMGQPNAQAAVSQVRACTYILELCHST